MQLTITVNLDNAAFEDNPEEELKRVLAQVTGFSDGLTRTLRDSNGNTVGHYVVTIED